MPVRGWGTQAKESLVGRGWRVGNRYFLEQCTVTTVAQFVVHEHLH